MDELVIDQGAYTTNQQIHVSVTICAKKAFKLNDR